MKFVTIFDLEFTAWEGSMRVRWNAPGEFREVVQIGAVKIDAETFTPLGEFEVLVRPKFNPVLSDYLIALTGITNEAIAERGIGFADAYDRFVRFIDGGTICAFGRDDLVLAENLQLYGIHGASPLPHHFNAAQWLRDNGIATKGYHACDMAKLCGAVFEGREHDALEDARSVALGIKTLVRRGTRNPFM